MGSIWGHFGTTLDKFQKHFEFSAHSGDLNGDGLPEVVYGTVHSDRVAFFENQMEAPSSIGESNRNDGYSLSPNPVRNISYLKLAELKGGISAVVLDTNGRVVQELSRGSSTSLEIDAKHLEDGFYVLKVISDDRLISIPMVIQK